MLKKFSCLIIIIILLGFAVIAQSQPPIPIGTQQNYQYPTKSTDEQPYKDKYNTESLKTTLKEITSKYQNQNIKNTGSQEHHWYDTFLDNTTNWLLVLFNLLLVVVTSLLVLYNYRLWKANVGLWEVSQEQSRHMETSIGVAHKAADAATATVKTMRDTAGRQLRAYLSARFETIFIFSPTIRVTIKFIMLNHGQTPAYNVTHSSLVEVLPYPLPINYQLPSISPPPDTTFVLHPTATLDGYSLAARNFSKEEISRIVNNDGYRIYTFGVVKYKDTFGRSRQTKFCYSVIGDNNLSTIATGNQTKVGLRIMFEPCSQYNEAN
ncbi:MAG: hypothetical protein WBV23_06245 [Desulfobaccales bacterium]